MKNFKIEAYLEYTIEDTMHKSVDIFFISSPKEVDFNYINTLVKNRHRNFDSVDIIVSKLNANESLKQ